MNERTKQEEAFRAAMKSGKVRRLNPKAPRGAGCNPTPAAVEEARTGKAFKGAVDAGKRLRNPPPSACRMVAKATGRTSMAGGAR